MRRTTVWALALAVATVAAVASATPGAEDALAPSAAASVRDLASDHASVRRRAAGALGRLGDPAAVEPLARALADPDAGVRREAARALAHLKEIGRAHV